MALSSLFNETSKLSTRQRRKRLKAFVAQWNLPPRNGVADIERAFLWTFRSSQYPQLGRVDLLRSYGVSRSLAGFENAGTVDMKRTIRFLYNPVWKDHTAAVQELEKSLDDLRSEALQAMKGAEEKAKSKDLSPMPTRWGKAELQRLARRLYEHSFQNKIWKEITDDESKRRGLRSGELRTESVMSSTGRFARRLGVSARRGTRPKH